MDNLFPPYEHRPTQRGRRFARLRSVPIRLVIPNLVTLIGLCAGLTSMRMAFDQRWEWAVAAIIFAAVLDGIDGRVARMLKGTSKFGAELDSLADFVNFGVAPAILLYTWSLNDLGSLGWIGAMLFAISMSLRLARFNAALDVEKPAWQGDFFTGVPAPAGAMLVLLPIYLTAFFHWPDGRGSAVVVLLYVLLIGFLTVSTVPTYSGKKTGARVKREWVVPLLALAVVALALLISYPFQVLAATSLAYLAGIPFGWRRYQELAAADATNRAAAVDDEVEAVPVDDLAPSEPPPGPSQTP